MASLKVSKDVRSHLLSHGLGGVQNQHYDRHTYWLEKRQALKKWAAYLAKLKEVKTANAVPLRGYSRAQSRHRRGSIRFRPISLSIVYQRLEARIFGYPAFRGSWTA